CGIPSLNLYISPSNSPTGPVTSRKLVYRFAESDERDNTRIYTEIIHTIAQNDRNELLLTYSINYGACDENSENVVKEDDGNFDPYYYRVKGVRVPYEMIGLQ